MDKDQITDILHQYLKHQKDIVFVYLYGSFVAQEKFRDIDVGIYSEYPKLSTLG